MVAVHSAISGFLPPKAEATTVAGEATGVRAVAPAVPARLCSRAMTDIGKFFRLDGKVALVTGGYGGIGSAVCRGLASAGARVAVAGRDAGKAKACAEAIKDAGGDAEVAVFDALSSADTTRMVDDVAARCGRLDILVNTVGGNQRAELADEVTEEGFEHVMRLNLTSAMFQSQASARHMIAGVVVENMFTSDRCEAFWH